MDNHLPRINSPALQNYLGGHRSGALPGQIAFYMISIRLDGKIDRWEASDERAKWCYTCRLWSHTLLPPLLTAFRT